MTRSAVALVVIAAACGGGAPTPVAPNVIGNTDQVAQVEIARAMTRDELYALVRRGDLTEVELPAADHRLTYGAADGEVRQVDDRLLVASCSGAPRTFLVDAQARLYLVPVVVPRGGAELREIDVPPCVEQTYQLEPGMVWAHRIELR